MTFAAMVVMFAAATGAEPCPLPSPAAAADARTARAYFEVGRRHEASGDRALAQQAYAQAVAEDPSDLEARAAYQRTCTAEHLERTIDTANARAEAGDCRGALQLLEAEPSTLSDAEGEVIAGGCALGLGDEARAIAWLESARADPKWADVASALLATVHLEAGRADLSRHEALEAMHSDDPELREAAARLRRLAARQGRLVTEVSLGGGYDSNVDLAPEVDAFQSGLGDPLGRANAEVLARPFGSSGPFVDAEVQYDAHLDVHTLDLGTARVMAGGQWFLPHAALAAGYLVDGSTLGGAPYLVSHGPFADVSLSTGPAHFGVSYSAQWQSFIDPSFAAYSGIVHSANARIGMRIAGLRMSLLYGLGRDLALAPEFSWVDHGPGLELAFAPSGPLRLRAELSYHPRHYDAVDPDLGIARDETWLRGAFSGEVDLSDTLTGWACVEATNTQANVPGLGWTRVVGLAGVRFQEGFL